MRRLPSRDALSEIADQRKAGCGADDSDAGSAHRRRNATPVLSWIRHPVSGFLLAFIAIACYPPDARALRLGSRLLHPKTYESPSKGFSLHVDPSDRYGSGDGDCSLKSNGRTIWSKTLPFTLWDAAVTDRGEVVGYAYTTGLQAIREFGELLCVILDHSGNIRMCDRIKRTFKFIDGPTHPLADGFLLAAEADRFILRVDGMDESTGEETWLTYQISTGKRVRTFRPKEQMTHRAPVGSIVEAQPLVGMPLYLARWTRTEKINGREDIGTRFTLIDDVGSEVWSLDLSRDYNAPGKRDYSFYQRVYYERTIVAIRPGEFDLRFVAEGKRVTYSVGRTPDSTWKVVEKQRADFLPAARPLRPSLAIAPEPLRRIELKGKEPTPPAKIRRIGNFAFDARGRIGFLRRDDSAVVLVDQDGSVLGEIPLFDPLPWHKYGQFGPVWVGGDKFVVVFVDYAADKATSAWLIRVDSGRVTVLRILDCDGVRAVAGCGAGWFAVLTNDSQTFESVVTAYSADGNLLWSLNSGDFPHHLSGPEDIAVTTDGRLAVLDNWEGAVQLFGKKGEFERVIPLAESWQRDPHPSNISADCFGGFIVGDSQGAPSVVWMTADGLVRNEFTARFPDGRTRPHMQDVVCDPTGRLWTTDNDAFCRLSKDGIVDLTFGKVTATNGLSEVAGIAIDSKQRIFALDEATGSVHIFDDRGNPLRTCAAAPTDFNCDLILPTITVSNEGSVFVGGDHSLQGRYLEYSPTGERRGFREVAETKGISQDWHCQPKKDVRWVIDYTEIYLVDRNDKVMKRITRRPDNGWVDQTGEASVAPDGSLAVFASASEDKRYARTTLNIYDPAGAPVRTISMPKNVRTFPDLAFDGERIAVTGENNSVLIFNAAGNPLFHFEYLLPLKADRISGLYFVAPDELWIWSGGRTIDRFRLPWDAAGSP